MDLQLNAMRRSINLSVYFVFDLEAGQSNFWVKICLALSGTVKREFSMRYNWSQRLFLIFSPHERTAREPPSGEKENPSGRKEKPRCFAAHVHRFAALSQLSQLNVARKAKRQ